MAQDSKTLSEAAKAASLTTLTEAMQKMASLTDEIKACGEGDDVTELQKSLQEVSKSIADMTLAETVEKKESTPKPAPKPVPVVDEVLKAMPEDQREAIAKMVSDAVIKSTEALISKNEALETQAVELTKSVQSEVDRRELAENVAVAKRDYGHLPGAEPDKMGAILKALGDKAPEELKGIQEILKASDEAIKRGNLYGEFVPQSGEPAPDDFTGRVKARAAEMVQKDASITPAAARVMAFKALAKEDPTAYASRNERN